MKKIYEFLAIASVRPGIQFVRSLPNDLFTLVPNDLQECIIDIDIRSINETVEIDGIQACLEYDVIARFAGKPRLLSCGKALLCLFGRGHIPYHSQNAIDALNLHRGCGDLHP